MSIEQIRKRYKETEPSVLQTREDVIALLDIIDNLSAETARWLSTVPFEDVEKSQEWYSLGKRHAAELIQGIIKGEIESEAPSIASMEPMDINPQMAAKVLAVAFSLEQQESVPGLTTWERAVQLATKMKRMNYFTKGEPTE